MFQIRIGYLVERSLRSSLSLVTESNVSKAPLTSLDTFIENCHQSKPNEK